MSLTENILVVSRALFEELGAFQGVLADPKKVEHYLKAFLAPGNSSFMERAAAEEDPSFKQLIPYIIIAAEGKILQYRRGKTSGEQRLLKKRSLGIGGHINDTDLHEKGAPFDAAAYQRALARELEEELNLDAALAGQELPSAFPPLALINDDATSVGSVHLGIVHCCYLPENCVTPREEAITELGFWDISVIQEHHEEFESWSQMLIPQLDHF